MKDYVKDPCFDCHVYVFLLLLWTQSQEEENKQTNTLHLFWSAELLTNKQVIMEVKKT